MKTQNVSIVSIVPWLMAIASLIGCGRDDASTGEDVAADETTVSAPVAQGALADVGGGTVPSQQSTYVPETLSDRVEAEALAETADTGSIIDNQATIEDDQVAADDTNDGEGEDGVQPEHGKGKAKGHSKDKTKGQAKGH